MHHLAALAATERCMSFTKDSSSPYLLWGKTLRQRVSLLCLRCGWAWFQLARHRPKTCPRCRKFTWDRELRAPGNRAPGANPGGRPFRYPQVAALTPGQAVDITCCADIHLGAGAEANSAWAASNLAACRAVLRYAKAHGWALELKPIRLGYRVTRYA